MEKRLVRNIPDKMIGGVAAGLADYLGIDMTVVRLLFVVATFLHGSGLLVYIVLWIAMPAGGSGPVYAGNPDAMNPGVPEAGTSPPGTPGSPPLERKRSENRTSVLIGWILVGFGVYFLMREFLGRWLSEFFYWFNFGRIWPVIFIIVGVLIITSARRKHAAPSSGNGDQASPPPEPAGGPSSTGPSSGPGGPSPDPTGPSGPAGPSSGPTGSNPGAPAGPTGPSPGSVGPPYSHRSPDPSDKSHNTEL